jgi:nitrous oxidase accessory protein
VKVLKWAQSEFPGIHPGGVTDSAPLMRPAFTLEDNSHIEHVAELNN